MPRMGDLKNFSSENELFVFLSFHLVGSGKSYRDDRQELEASLTKLFSNSGFKLDHEDPEGPQERELVYGLKKPLLEDEEELLRFFTRLETLFTDNKHFIPSFTQGSEAFA